MVTFEISSRPHPQWVGGPPAYCHVCNFPHEKAKGFLVARGIKVLMHDQIEVDLHLCLDEHAAALKAALDEVLPDERLPKAQAAVLKAEAARARAEKRAEKAEAALFAMQDWVSEKPAGAAAQ